MGIILPLKKNKVVHDLNTTLTLYNCCFYISKSLNRLGRRIVRRGPVDGVVHEGGLFENGGRVGSSGGFEGLSSISGSAISSSRVLLTGKGDMISKGVGDMVSRAEAMSSLLLV